jgi:hypothetical protein
MVASIPANVKPEYMLKNISPNVTFLQFPSQAGEKLFLNRLDMILSFAQNAEQQ